MKNRILIIASLMTAFSFCFTKLQSQVTIGTQSAPLKGTLLDLKENDDPTGGVTSTNGIMLPRVNLTGLTNLAPIADASANKLQYTGMTVYNVTVDDNAGLQEGLYAWDGAKWNHVLTGEQNTGFSVGNGLSFSAGSVVLGGSLNRNTVVDMNNKNIVFSNTGNVGIGTENPTANLEVAGAVKIDSKMSVADTLTANGPVFLKSLVNVPAGKTVAQIGIDDTGEVKKFGTPANSYPLTYLVYKITSPLGSGSGRSQKRFTVSDYNTGIPSDQYTLIVVGSFLNTLGGDMMTNVTGDFAPLSVYAFDSNSTWHITADYPGGTMHDNTAGVWTLYCVAINHSMVKDIPDQIDTISGDPPTGAALSIPEGL